MPVELPYSTRKQAQVNCDNEISPHYFFSRLKFHPVVKTREAAIPIICANARAKTRQGGKGAAGKKTP